MTEEKIAIFKGKNIRKIIHNNEWWFVVEDVVLGLIDSKAEPFKRWLAKVTKAPLSVIPSLTWNPENFWIPNPNFIRLRMTITIW